MGDGASDDTTAVAERRSIDALEAELSEVSGVLNAAHARLVALVAEALAGEQWAQTGIRSPDHWLAWKTGLSPRRAAEVVVIARRAGELPATMATFAEGRLAVDQVVPIARHAPAHNDAEACELATNATVAQLRRTLATYAFADAASTLDATHDASPSPPREQVSFGFGDDGRFWLHADLEADRGAIVESAMREARDRLFTAGRRDVTWSDALDDLCQRSLDALTSTRRDRFTNMVHLDVDHLDASHLDQVALPDTLRRYLTCDGSITPVWERDPTLRGGPQPAHRPVAHPSPGGRPRQGLPVPRLHQHDRHAGPPSAPLGGRVPDRSRQPRPAVRTAPPGTPPGRLRRQRESGAARRAEVHPPRRHGHPGRASPATAAGR